MLCSRRVRKEKEIDCKNKENAGRRLSVRIQMKRSKANDDKRWDKSHEKRRAKDIFHISWLIELT